ncbi:MAG: DUF4445 domain-containing protein [Clostridiales bacterium]|nr:DUF4445 domain-containing protein [Clostridiales bacterium]
MPTLTIRRGQQAITLPFDAPAPIAALLEQAGMTFAKPCGGRGVCGKCAVLLEGAVSQPNAAEVRCGARLACQAVALGDARVILPQEQPIGQIEAGCAAALQPVQPMPGRLGAAIDVGTTTLALRLYDLISGESLASATMLNPQTSVAADVIGRIDAAMHGGQEKLRASIVSALHALLFRACAQADRAENEVASLVVTGNTTMLYLLTGREPTALSRAPFQADCLFDFECELLGRRAYLPPCLHAFVGADTACALLASGMSESGETALLCDIGTNGEIALWHRGRLSVASTAAGPAFEGAGISCGCGSIPGAIDRVDVESGALRLHTIGEQPAAGLCGSGLVDAVAALLATGAIDETGATEDDRCLLADGVALTQQDIRAVQLAKAAMAAGVAALLYDGGCRESDVASVCLAGGFGSHLNVGSAAAIGLISRGLADRVRVIGNAALDGAAMLLMDTSLRQKLRSLSAQAKHVRLDGNPFFSGRYIEEMLFPEAE